MEVREMKRLILVVLAIVALTAGAFAQSTPEIDKPLLAAMARPDDVGELNWLRAQGIEVLLSLTEDPPRRDWVNEAGLMPKPSVRSTKRPQ